MQPLERPCKLERAGSGYTPRHEARCRWHVHNGLKQHGRDGRLLWEVQPEQGLKDLELDCRWLPRFDGQSQRRLHACLQAAEHRVFREGG
jgi:hypothetical protein